MNKAKILEAVKNLKEAFMTSEQKFTDAKLNDGVTIVRYDGDALVVGMPVLAVTDQGAIPMPDGDYSLEDGTAFTIMNGIVAEVAAAAEEAQDTEEAAAPSAAQPMAEATPKSIIESIIKESRFATEDFVTEKLAEITAVKESFATQKESDLAIIKELNEKADKQAETIKAMFSILEEMANEPSEKPTDTKKQAFNVADARKSFRANLAKLQTED